MNRRTTPRPRPRHRRWRRQLAIVSSFALLCGLATTGTASASDPIQYTFEFVNGTTLSGVSDDKTVFLAEAGGTSADNPIGMEVHVSCSDDFPGGFGEKDGPDPVRDSAWQIERYEIIKGKKRCGDSFAPPPPPPGSDPSIDLVKTVNGEDANSPTGPVVRVGDTVTLGYRVSNDGDVTLTDIELEDLTLGPVPCPTTTLQPGESVECESRTELVTQAGQVFMEAEVTAQGQVATGIDPGTIAGVRDKARLYKFNFVNGVTLQGEAEKTDQFLPNAGGTSVENPIGMEVHLSCSDEFPGGFSEKRSPDPARDPAWQIASWEILKVKEGTVEKRCGNAGAPVEQTVTDRDPIHYLAEPKVAVPPPSECEAQPYGTDDDQILSWSSVDVAEVYAVWRDGSHLATTRQTVFVDTMPTDGASYEVRTETADGGRSVFIDCVPVDPPPPPSLHPPEICEVFDTPAGNKVAWSSVDGALRYVVWRNGRYLATDDASPYLDEHGGHGDTYKVRAIGRNGTKSDFVHCTTGGASG